MNFKDITVAIQGEAYNDKSQDRSEKTGEED